MSNRNFKIGSRPFLSRRAIPEFFGQPYVVSHSGDLAAFLDQLGIAFAPALGSNVHLWIVWRLLVDLESKRQSKPTLCFFQEQNVNMTHSASLRLRFAPTPIKKVSGDLLLYLWAVSRNPRGPRSRSQLQLTKWINPTSIDSQQISVRHLLLSSKLGSHSSLPISTAPIRAHATPLGVQSRRLDLLRPQFTRNTRRPLFI